MGSLVMSQVALGIGQSPYDRIMVDGNTHQDEASGIAPTSSQNRARSRSTADAPATPSSPALQPRNAPPPSSQPSAGAHPTVRVESASVTGVTRPQSTSHHAHSSDQYSRGFDQSGFPLSSEPSGLASSSPSSPSSPRLQPTYRSTRSLGGSEATSPSRIKVRNLSHIQSFASEEYLARPRLGHRTGSSVLDSGRQYEISSMPVTDIIEMVAELLTKITSTNDRQYEHVHRPIPPPEEQANLNPQTSCVLAFHGKNVPSITILSYLSRIHKYCPTTYEVFLSLLVYFDRMTDTVNRNFLKSMQEHSLDSSRTNIGSPTPTPRSPMPMQIDNPHETTDASTPPASGSIAPSDRTTSARLPPSPPTQAAPGDLSQFFVVDSYNIHRLVIAGVTCASKFFSDVFYTNSRYAKVGGLPLVELNHLELQFLLLNDFRLSVPVEELEAYGTMLVEFYAREIVTQQQAAQHQNSQHLGPHTADGMYMRDSARRPT